MADTSKGKGRAAPRPAVGARPGGQRRKQERRKAPADPARRRRRARPARDRGRSRCGRRRATTTAASSARSARSPSPATRCPGSTTRRTTPPSALTAPTVTATNLRDAGRPHDRARRQAQGAAVPRPLVPALPGRGPGAAAVARGRRRALPADVEIMAIATGLDPSAATTRRRSGCSATRAGSSR